MTKFLTAVDHDPEEEILLRLEGKFLDESWYDTVIAEDAVVSKPDGLPLLVFLKDVIPLDLCTAAYHGLRKAARPTRNRGTAAGGGSFTPVRKSGVVSKTTEARRIVKSGIAGFFDRYQRMPICRQTAYNADNPEKFEAALPYIQKVNDLFHDHAAARWANQRDMCARTHPEYVIPGTVFTTITVNKNFRTAVHKDAGDFRGGFGVMSALTTGIYSGAYTIFPRYRIAADMRTGDLLLADVHEYHCNAPFYGSRYERISLVFYYRENMIRCGTAAEELARAKKAEGKGSVWD